VKDEAGQIGGVGVVIQETKNKDMEIIQIVPGGPAHLSGVVRIGDIVESVDGLFVSGPSKFLPTYFSSEITLKLRAEQGLSFLMSCVSFWEKAALTSPSVLFGMEQL
jgi:C-terminal processing protease CtpA/Prc